MAYKRVYYILLSSLFFVAYTEAQEPAELKSNPSQTDVQATSRVDTVLELVKDKEIPVPVVQAPSKFEIWKRSLGIAFFYKYGIAAQDAYRAVKDWFKKKLYRKS